MKKLILLNCFQVILIASSAQVPGFMGKRLAVGYSASLHPAFGFAFNVNTAYDGTKIPTFHIGIRHNLHAEYAIGKRVSVDGSIGFSKEGLFTYEIENNQLKQDYPFLSKYYDLKNGDPRNYDYIRANNMLYKVGFNFFTSNYIAPHGKYWNIAYLLNRGTIQYVFNNQVKDLAMITNHGFAISRGYRRIIKESFIIDYGFGFGTVFGAKSGASEEGDGDLISDQTVALNTRLLFHINLGIRYLIPKSKKASRT
jgi:hypothetical protein